MFPLNKNLLAIITVAIIVLTFFIAGLFEVLEDVTIKWTLIGATGIIVLCTFIFLIKNSSNEKSS